MRYLIHCCWAATLVACAKPEQPPAKETTAEAAAAPASAPAAASAAAPAPAPLSLRNLRVEGTRAP